MSIKKSLITYALLSVFTVSAWAQSKQKAEIKEATVFLNGAELFSTSKVQLPAGETEVIFTNIAGQINERSLNVGADNSVVVQSATFSTNYLGDEALSARAQEIKDSIVYLEEKRELINNQVRTVDEQISVIQQNKQLSGKDHGVSVSDLQKLLDLVKNNMAKLLDEKNSLNKDIKKTNERLQLLAQQLREEQSRGYQPGGQLIVKFYSKRATSSNITISYVVPNAGWSPSYDLRVDEVGGPVQLNYKAHVFQNSGVSWDKIKLSLSTGNPNEGAEAPVMNPWYLAFYMPRPVQYTNQIESMPTRDTRSMASTSAGAYSEKDGGAVSMSGGRSDGTLYYVDGVQVYGAKGIDQSSKKAMNNYVSTNNQGINTVFDIDLPYTIPSDGKQHNVAVKTAQLNATYRYYTVPKLDRDAFLQAHITGWEDLNLLPASTNIFYEGTYVGQGYIDVRNVKDTMNLSLGRDKKIVVRRERDKELRTVKTIGSTVKETYVYKISVRNTRNKAIDVVVMDQVPISNDNNIEVMDKDHKGGDYNQETGAVTWKLQMQPNETKELILGYTVKYPKDKQINL